MEEQSQTETIQTFSRQHEDGEVFEAQSIEMARGMCPVLGKMSVEEAGLLLELEAMGKEQMDSKLDQPEKAVAERSVIERVETVPKPDKKSATIDVATKITAEAISADTHAKQVFDAERQHFAVSERKDNNNNRDTILEAISADIHLSLLAQQETTWAASVVTDAALMDSQEGFAQKQTPQIKLSNKTQAIYPTPRVEEVIEGAQGLEVQIDALEPEVPPLSIDEQLHENIDEHLEPVFDTLGLIEVAEPTEVQERLSGYNLLTDDDVVLLLTELEQNEAVRYESVETPLTELCADTDKTDAERLNEDEVQTIFTVPELPAPVEEIETSITHLAEVLELTEPDESHRVFQILEEIIALPVKQEETAGINTVELEEKLEELFIELFEEAKIKYTPELIMSFIKLTKAHYLEELLETVKEEDAGRLQDETGTHEFLQKLKHGLSNMKQAVTNVYEIGKSVLRLYSVSKSMALVST